MNIDLTGKRGIITAGGSGIGRAIAEEFSASGAAVAVCDINSTALEGLPNLADMPSGAETNRAGVIAGSIANVSDSDAVDRFFDFAVDWLGGLDFLVNNAGISGPTKAVEDISPDEWRETMDVNVNGQFYFVRRAVPIFRQQRAGVILNMSSSAGRLGMPLRSPYSTSKYAVRGLTDALAVELGNDNIRVNALLPGLVDGVRGQRVIAEQAEAAGKSYEEYLPSLLHNISMHTVISQKEIADLALFLVSDLACHISGQSIGVCGNFESYRAPMNAQA
jgi:NAD(P)-dependent dehydrogenase (short-subunit alcohol dehydrogenase family)